jgi:hypothetical protein
MKLSCMKFLYALVLSAVSAVPLSKTVDPANDDYNCARWEIDEDTNRCDPSYLHYSQNDAPLYKRNVVVNGQYK